MDYLTNYAKEKVDLDEKELEEIASLFSKKSYKKALGALYKRKQILIEKDKIRLL